MAADYNLSNPTGGEWPPGACRAATGISWTLSRRPWSQTALRSFEILVHVKILYETRLRDNSVRCDAELVTY